MKHYRIVATVTAITLAMLLLASCAGRSLDPRQVKGEQTIAAVALRTFWQDRLDKSQHGPRDYVMVRYTSDSPQSLYHRVHFTDDFMQKSAKIFAEKLSGKFDSKIVTYTDGPELVAQIQKDYLVSAIGGKNNRKWRNFDDKVLDDPIAALKEAGVDYLAILIFIPTAKLESHADKSASLFSPLTFYIVDTASGEHVFTPYYRLTDKVFKAKLKAEDLEKCHLEKVTSLFDIVTPHNLRQLQKKCRFPMLEDEMLALIPPILDKQMEKIREED